MADSNIPVTSGSGNTVDTRTVGSDHRQVIVVGDPDTNANVADVQNEDATQTSTLQGLVVRLAGSARVHQATAGTFAVYFDPANPAVNIGSGTIGVHLTGTSGTVWVKSDPDATLGGIRTSISTYISGTSGTIWTKSDPDATLGGIRTSISTYISGTAGTIAANIGTIAGTAAVFFSPAEPTIKGITNSISTYLSGTSGTIWVKNDPDATLGGIRTSVAVYFSPTEPTIKGITNSISTYISGTAGTLWVKTDADSTIGSIRNITNSINVYLSATAGTIAANVGKVDGTIFVGFSPSRPVVLADAQSTASIFTVSSSTSTAGNTTIVSPSSAYNFKVFAYTISTTGIVSIAPRFTTGASAGATELWRPLATPAASTSAPVGANLAVQPPGFIFATGVNATLALYLDAATLVHYSVSYLKESA